jgi:hypothetical protein
MLREYQAQALPKVILRKVKKGKLIETSPKDCLAECLALLKHTL